MSSAKKYKDIGVTQDGHVVTVEIRRPPNNFFDNALIAQIGDAFDAADADPQVRSIVLAAEGKAFCAGADFANRKPIVAAVQGAAVGGGLGLALVADFRVTCNEARFSANFNRLGFHPGFGLTTTLPRLVGPQKAALLFYTGRRIPGDEAVAMGLADQLVPLAEIRAAAQALALEIAQSAPLAVLSTRETVRRGLADEIEASTERELVEQEWLRRTADFKEGVKAMADRRLPNFQGK
jgi:enoyl-CoA hydratase/carnithine racemase